MHFDHFALCCRADFVSEFFVLLLYKSLSWCKDNVRVSSSHACAASPSEKSSHITIEVVVTTQSIM